MPQSPEAVPGSNPQEALIRVGNQALERIQSGDLVPKEEGPLVKPEEKSESGELVPEGEIIEGEIVLSPEDIFKSELSDAEALMRDIESDSQAIEAIDEQALAERTKIQALQQELGVSKDKNVKSANLALLEQRRGQLDTELQTRQEHYQEVTARLIESLFSSENAFVEDAYRRLGVISPRVPAPVFREWFAQDPYVLSRQDLLSLGTLFREPQQAEQESSEKGLLADLFKSIGAWANRHLEKQAAKKEHAAEAAAEPAHEEVIEGEPVLEEEKPQIEAPAIAGTADNVRTFPEARPVRGELNPAPAHIEVEGLNQANQKKQSDQERIAA